MYGIELLTLLTAGMAGLGAVEYSLHRRNLARIPTRLHVSGTRGKSSVTRLIAAGMNHAGISAAAKTTGTLARLILPDGREVPVFRPLGANIIEQKRIISAAADMKVRALVVECMALQPILHWISENHLVRATHGVITNARADHLDVMGPTEADVARALAGMIPVNGVLFTAERQHLAILEAAAADRHTRVVAVSDADVDAITDEDLAGFSYTEHRENIALVLKILTEFGVDRKTAIEGMWTTRPDPGALSEHTVDYFGRRLNFINGFAANDPESTERIWRYAVAKYDDVDRTIAVLNLRGDRPSRTVQLAEDASFWQEADRVLLIGTGAYLFMRLATRKGVSPDRLINAEVDRIDDVFERILEMAGRKSLVVGMGNIGGQGLGLVRFFKNRANLER